MKVSKRIIEFSKQTICLSNQGSLFGENYVARFALCNGAALEVFIRNGALSATIAEDNEVNTILHGMIAGFLSLRRNYSYPQLESIQFRELENMLRDVNSVKSFEDEYQEKIEQAFHTFKKIFQRYDVFIKYLIENEGLGFPLKLRELSFFEQLQALDKLRTTFASIFGLKVNILPRLNKWFPEKGELSFIVCQKTRLDRIDGVLFTSFWSKIEGIETINMLASEK